MHRLTDWDPKDPDVCPETPQGFTGASRRAFTNVTIHLDRVEIQDVWDFTMGHATTYVECAIASFRRGDPELMGVVARKLQPEIVAQIAKMLGVAVPATPSPSPSPSAGDVVRPVDHTKLDYVFVDKVNRFALNLDPVTGRTFVSFPVHNRMATYEEYYEIDRAAFDRYKSDPTLAHDFVAKAKARELDHLLLLKPGTDRGFPD